MKEQQKTCCFYDPRDLAGCRTMDERVCESRECTICLTEQQLKDSRLASYKRRSEMAREATRRLGFTVTLKAIKDAGC